LCKLKSVIIKTVKTVINYGFKVLLTHGLIRGLMANS